MRISLLLNRPSPGAGADDLDTLVQAGVVRGALQSLGHEALTTTFTLNLPETVSQLRGAAPDLVFNLVEGAGGSGRAIHYAPALLEDLGLPFTGAGASAMALSSNKLFAKAVLRAGGVSTPDWRTLPGLARLDPADASARGEWIVKSVWEHASIGMNAGSVLRTTHPEELSDALLERAPDMGGECFAEAYVAGREFNIAVLGGPQGPEVLPPAEMVFTGDWGQAPRILDYAAKWDEGCPAYAASRRSFDFGPGDAPLLAALRAATLDCWRAFGLSGYARVDFRVGPGGAPQVIDVNANPCLSPDGGFSAALERAGLPFEEAVMRIVSAGLDRPGFSHSRKAA